MDVQSGLLLGAVLRGRGQHRPMLHPKLDVQSLGYDSNSDNDDTIRHPYFPDRPVEDTR